MSTAALTRPTWHKIGEYVFSESGRPIIQHRTDLKNLPNFSVLDDPNFAALINSVQDIDTQVKIENNPNTNKPNRINLQIKGSASTIIQKRRIAEVSPQTESDFKKLLDIEESENSIDLTEQYKALLECKPAVVEYNLSLKRVHGFNGGYGIIGEPRYIEFFTSTLSIPQGQDLSITEASEIPSFIDYEKTRFLHTNITGKEYLIIKDDSYMIFVKRSLQPKTDLSKLSKLISACVNNKAEPTWIIDHSLFTDIKKISGDMHLMATHQKQSSITNGSEQILKTIEFRSMSSKSIILLNLEENNCPKIALKFSTLAPFKNAIKQNERILVYVFKNAIGEGKDVNLLEYQVDNSGKTIGRKKKTTAEEEQVKTWTTKRFGLIA